MKISDACKSYFNGFKEIQKYKKNTFEVNALAVFKIISYGTIIIPAGFGLAYGLSELYGRVKKVSKPSQQDQGVSQKGQKVLAPNKNLAFKKDVNIPELKEKANKHFNDSRYKDTIIACVLLVLNDPLLKKDPDTYMNDWIKRNKAEKMGRHIHKIGEDDALAFFVKELRLDPVQL